MLPQRKSATNDDLPSAVDKMVLGRFRVVRALAKGGMGTVYLARSEGAAGFVRPVVIKRSLGSGSADVISMFAREARILSNLRHPGIVGIVDFAEDNGDYAMVLDYVHGYTLTQWIRFARQQRRQLPVNLAAYAVVRILEALEYAHSLSAPNGTPLGIVHRDIKASNVLIDVEGVVKLADFGIARADADATDTTTNSRSLKGTLSYMAPELFAGKPPSPRSDVYSTAVTAYQLLCGVNPFHNSDPAVAAARTMQHEPELLSEVRPEVGRPLAAIIARGMHKDPEQRFQSAGAMVEAVRQVCRIDPNLESEFREAVQADFNDPEFAKVNQTDSLAERERAWSSFCPPDESSDSVAGALASTESSIPLSSATDSDQAREEAAATRTSSTVAEGPPGLARKRRRQRAMKSRFRQPWLWASTAVVLAAAALAAGLLPGDEGDGATEQPTVVMVRGDVSMEDQRDEPEPDEPDEPDAEPGIESAGVVAAGLPAEKPLEPGVGQGEGDLAAEEPPQARETTPAPVAKPPTARGQAPASGLTNTFRRRQRVMAKCFERFPGAVDDIDGIGELAVRFRINKKGRVVAATLTPDTVARMPLGKCLTSVATKTRFGRQKSALSFRIPIKVKGG